MVELHKGHANEISSLLNIIYHGNLLSSDKLLLFVGLCWYRPDFAKKNRSLQAIR